MCLRYVSASRESLLLRAPMLAYTILVLFHLNPIKDPTLDLCSLLICALFSVTTCESRFSAGS
jgi:hypothetical protein